MLDIRGAIAEMPPEKRKMFIALMNEKRRLTSAFSSKPKSAMTVKEMLAEAVLPAHVDPDRAQPGLESAESAPREILLTGATGFIGAFLLDALLRRTGARVHCLIRADSEDRAWARLVENMARYRLPVPKVGGRVVVVPGDFTLPDLGLDRTRLDRLAAEIDTIHHGGAAVKWTQPFARLRSANVTGTEQILAFATTGRLKSVHFLSTIGVFSSAEFRGDRVTETEPLENSGALEVGYAQSKWVAEKLVRLAGERGVPITIHRPNTGAHSQTGAFNRNDHISQMIRGCLAMKAAPKVAFSIAAAPIDYVADAIAHLSVHHPADMDTFHLVNPVDVDWRDVAVWLMDHGYDLTLVGYDDWKSRLTRSIGDLGGFSLAPFFTDGLFERVFLADFDTTLTQSALSGSGITCSEPKYERFRHCLDYFVDTGFLPATSSGHLSESTRTS